MRKVNQLTPLKMASFKKVGRYADGLGLYLNIDKGGSRSWLFRYSLGGKHHWLGLGPLHTVNLQEARERAHQQRQLIADAHDPATVKRDALAALRVTELRSLTFRQAVEQFLATERLESFKSDVHRKQWHSTLGEVSRAIGELPLQSIDSAIVLQALLPIWTRASETGSRTRGRMERVFAWAKAHKLFDGENPATRDVLRDALPAKAKTEHHKALPYAELPAFMGHLRGRDSVSARCLEFTILTAVRTSEAIGATWDEIDLDKAVWTIPAHRMKADRAHRVPLCKRAVEILRQKIGPGSSGHVFINGGGKPLSNMAMLELLRGMAGNGYTVHGFRSAFMDWAHECTDTPKVVIDMALAHVVGDKVEAAYRRGDLFDKRRALMDEWGGYCAR